MDTWDLETLYKSPPPKFGHGMHKYFPFDPEYVNLNHGSYGSLPLPVLSVCNALTLQIESNPDLYLRLTYQPHLIAVRARLAKLIGAKTDECVLVQNASMGINTVLRNIEWEKGDVLVPCSTTYGSISRTVENLHDMLPNPTIAEFTIAFPTDHDTILRTFRDHLRALPQGNMKKVAVIDSIVSNPGVRMPWKEMAQMCKEEGVLSVVDAAHSIGQEVDIDLTAAAPDFWVSNCHKWLYAKRSCAILYVPERNQHIVKSSIPTSHVYRSPSKRTGSGFVEQYEWNGTIDFVPYLSAAAALDFRTWIGGEAKINEYCHDMALRGGKRLAEIFGTRVLDPDGDLTLNMVNVELPLPPTLKPTLEMDEQIKDRMLRGHKAYAAHFYHAGRWWTRCSAQVWTEIEDFDKVGKAFLAVCAEIVAEFTPQQSKY